MALSSAHFGNFRLYAIPAGTFRLDGGAMFGVVPKTLWSRHYDSDEENRILLTTRCLLVHSETTGKVYLIDTGIGQKFDNKFSRIYDLDFSEYTLVKSLNHHGFATSDVTDVVFTHMHFDHCGGSVHLDPDGFPALTFPGARHWVHKRQWQSVLTPNEREKPSFLVENIQPLANSGLLHHIGDDHVYEPGFRVKIVNGHTTCQQLPVLSDGDRQILFAADLMPTTIHLPLSWVMGFDIRPLETLEERKEMLSQCLGKNILLFLEHDPFHELIRLGGQPHRATVEWSGRLNDL